MGTSSASADAARPSALKDSLGELQLSFCVTVLSLCGLDSDTEDCEKRLRCENAALGRWGCDCDAYNFDGPAG